MPTFLDRDGGDDQGDARVGPGQAERGVKREPDEQHAGQVGTQQGLFGVGHRAGRAEFPTRATPDEDTFVQSLLASLGSYPAYFDRLAQANRRGPALLPAAVDLAPLPAAMVRSLLGQGGQLVDVRPVTEFAAGHIAGAVSIPLRDAFATWLGWVLPPDVPLVFVLGPGQDPAEVVWQAAKIGYDHLAGRLAGGMDAWRSDGGSVRTVELVTAVTGRLLEKGP